MSIFKKLIKYIFLFIIGILLLLITNSLINFFKIDFIDFSRSQNQLVKKAKAINKKASSFDGDNILKNMVTNKFNGFCYRFDDFIDDAVLTQLPGFAKFEDDAPGITYEFNNPQDVPLTPRNNNYSVKNGILKYTFGLSKTKYDQLNILENNHEISIDRKNVDKIEIKMKVKNTIRFDLGFSSDPEADIYDHYQTEFLSVSTVPDNSFHVYTVDAMGFEKSWLNSKEPIRKFCLWPGEFKKNFKEDEIEIEYIRFLSKRSEYEKQPYDVVYVTRAEEMRKAIYLHSGHMLKFQLTVPDANVFLSFGMGFLGDSPVTFNVKMFTEGQQKILLEKEIVSEERWHDVEIALEGFTVGEDIILEFSAQSESFAVSFWSNPVLYSTPKNKFNAVIALEDALRADHMSCYGYSKKTTPVKDEFCKDGILFSRAFSQATFTRASCISFMTSLYPSASGVWNKYEMLHDNYLTLAEIMRSQGFVTIMLTQNVNAGPHSGLHQGFSYIFDANTLGYLASGIYQSGLIEYCLEKNKNRNLFIYLHVIDPHAPYAPPYNEEFYEELNNSNNRSLKDFKRAEKTHVYDPKSIDNPTRESRIFLYDEEIRYNDECFQDFLNIFKDLNIYNHTLIAFIADHGEHLDERGIWGHCPPGYQQVLHVPMIITYPEKIPQNIKIDTTVQLIDIMPTILDYAGIENNQFLIEGDSLRSLIDNQNQDFWSTRLCYSDEILSSTKEWAFGSLFYNNLHVVTSEVVKHSLSSYLLELNSPRSLSFLNRQFFNMHNDQQEFNPIFIYEVDLFLSYHIFNFLKQLRQEHLDISQKITKNISTKANIKETDIEILKTLGYIE